jgi:hypothetical protein
MISRKIKKTKTKTLKAIQKLRYNEPQKVKICFVSFNRWKTRSKALTRKEVIEQYNIQDFT